MSSIPVAVDQSAPIDRRLGNRATLLIGTSAPPSHIAIDPSAPVDPLLRDKEGARMFGISVPTFWRRVADGTIPKPLKLGGMSRWPRSEILEAIEQLKAKRSAAAA
jgi:predicted DNA-binding transcriptional regulator AlpA